MLYQLIDWLATYAECAAMLSIATTTCGIEFIGRKKVFLFLFLSGCNAILVAILNSLSAFSFVTPLFSIACLFLATRFLAKGNWVLRAAASIIPLFVVQSIDYILMITVCMIYGGPFDRAFAVFLVPGILRSCYLILDKLMDWLSFLALRKRLTKLSNLRKQWLTVLFVASIFHYWIMQYLFNIILDGDYAKLQGTYILFFFFLPCFMVVILMLLLSMTATESERMKNRLLQSTNQMMEENYQTIHQDLQANARMIHDFHHHLRAIRGIAGRESAKEVLSYVDLILAASYREVDLCHSGNDVIDAVINCNGAEAKRKQILFHYDVNLYSPLTIDSVDICAVLANQIENAIEACEKIPDVKDRFVNVEIAQHEGFVVFTVINSALNNPFDKDEHLISNKESHGISHGFGVRNIQETANKYNGQLKTQYENGVFTSTVLLCFSTI